MLKCPKCFQKDSFTIITAGTSYFSYQYPGEPTQFHETSQERDEVTRTDVDYSDTDGCSCVVCQHAGEVSEFKNLMFIYIWENCDGEGHTMVSDIYDTEDEAKKAAQKMLDEVETDSATITWDANGDGEADLGSGVITAFTVKSIKKA
jgi:hypothetical protein